MTLIALKAELKSTFGGTDIVDVTGTIGSHIFGLYSGCQVTGGIGFDSIVGGIRCGSMGGIGGIGQHGIGSCICGIGNIGLRLLSGVVAGAAGLRHRLL